MSSKLTNQAGKGNISLLGCVVVQAHPSNCAAHAGSQALHQLFFPAAAQEPEIRAAFICQLSSKDQRLSKLHFGFADCVTRKLFFSFYSFIFLLRYDARSFAVFVCSEVEFDNKVM